MRTSPHQAHAPPGEFDLELGELAEARLLLLYILIPEPGPRVSISAEEALSRTEASEALWRLQARSSGPEGRTSDIRLLGEDEQFLPLPPSASLGGTLSTSSRPQLLLLDAEHRAGNSRYGAAYRYEGPDRRSTRKYGALSNVKWHRDQESLEVWHAQRLGDTRLKLFLTEFQSNPGQDPGRYSIDSLNGGLSLNQRLERTPLYLTLSGSQGTSSAALAPPGREPFSSRSWNTYNAALSVYPSRRWDAYISTGYSSAGDLSRTGEAEDFYWHEAGVAIHPTWDTVLKPTVALGKIRNERTGDQIDYPFASLALTFFDLLPAFEVTLWSSYARMTSGEAALDTTSADASLRLSRKLPDASDKATLSLELGWSSHRDHLVPSRSYEGVSGMALLRFAF